MGKDLELEAILEDSEFYEYISFVFNYPHLLNIQQVAKILNVSNQSVYRFIDEGRFVRISGKVPRKSLLRYMEKSYLKENSSKKHS